MKHRVIIAVLSVACFAAFILGVRAFVQNNKLIEQMNTVRAEYEAIAKVVDGNATNNGTQAPADSEELKKAQEKIEALEEGNNSCKKLIMFALDMDLDEENPDDYTLSELIETLIGKGGFNYGDVHPIWDDTEVVNAYKTGDDSAITDEKDLFVLSKVREVIPQIIKDGMTDFEKEMAVYTWLVKYVQFYAGDYFEDASDYTHMPYGVLKFHQAICVGNSTTFKLFLDCLDVPCMIIHSTEVGEHAWNLVQIDGDWYHVDLTFDQVNGSEPAYTYFNVPDSVKDGMGYPWDHSDFPAATSLKYNYGYMNASEAKSLLAVPKIIKKNIEKYSGIIPILVPTNQAEYMSLILQTISNNYDGLALEEYMLIEDVENDRILFFISFTNYNYDPEPVEPLPDDPEDPQEPEVDSKFMEELDKIMKETFGFGLDLWYYNEAPVDYILF